MTNDPLERFTLSAATNRKIQFAVQGASLVLLWVVWGFLVWASPKDWKMITGLFAAATAVIVFKIWAQLRDDGLNPALRKQKPNKPSEPPRGTGP
jgi:hypothetical protein